MTVINAIILGLVQGIAEFLPISSSGHLAILNNLFGMTTTENGHMFFDVLLHLGTLGAVFIAYWKDIALLKERISPYTAVDSIHYLRFPGGSTNTVSHKYGGSGIMKRLKAQAEELILTELVYN